MPLCVNEAVHRSKLEQDKRSSVVTGTNVPVQHGPPHRQPNNEGDHRHDRGQQKQRRSANKDINEAFQEAIHD
jgi:hypothetical protein